MGEIFGYSLVKAPGVRVHWKNNRFCVPSHHLSMFVS